MTNANGTTTSCLTPDDHATLMAALACYAKAKDAEFANTPERDAKARRFADMAARDAKSLRHLIEYAFDIVVVRGTPVCDQPD